MNFESFCLLLLFFFLGGGLFLGMKMFVDTETL